MGVQLNIKDEVLHRKAQEWAKQDGQSVTATIRAVFDRESERRASEYAARLARMTAFSDEIYATLPDDVKKRTSKEIMDSIYDDNTDDGFAR